MCRSVPQIDATFTRTRTSLRPNAGILTSRISAPGAAFAFTTASIVSDMNLPYEFAFKNKTLNSSIPVVRSDGRSTGKRTSGPAPEARLYHNSEYLSERSIPSTFHAEHSASSTQLTGNVWPGRRSVRCVGHNARFADSRLA